jgi:hypothetical protein
VMPSKRKNIIQPLRNERGILTFDFMFALFMAIGFAIVLFSVSITLSLVEVAQYVTYATSRAYNGGHETQDLQTQNGQNKYNDIMSNSVFKGIFGLGLVTLSAPQLSDFSSDYAEDDPDNAIEVGARIPMDAKLLHLNIPLLGSTTEDSSIGKATLNSYLMREVSTTECREGFNRVRYDNINQLSPYSAAPNAKAVLITDNGC